MTAPPAGPGSRVVVVGAGHGAAGLVALLRQEGHTGSITVVGDEVDHPYHRPPLSKKFATGDELEQWLRPAEFYREQDVTIRLAEEVTDVDRDARSIGLASGERIDYDVLVLATGAAPRALPTPGAGLDGVGFLRTLPDARRLAKWVSEKRRVVVIGGGYIGLEVAAVARGCDADTVVLEREDRVLARVASPDLSRILTERHTERGTEIRTGVSVAELTGSGGQVRSTVLDSGEEIPCEAVLVGIGAEPRDDLALAAGLEPGPQGRGVLVDEGARTSDPHVLAIGDVTCRPVMGVDGPHRLESIPGTTEQSRQAVATILGRPLPAAETPWFWSDQFDLKLKIAGVLRSGSDVVLRGDPATGKFALFHLDGDRPVAVETSNSSPEFMAGKKWIGTRARVDRGLLGDVAASLKDVVR